MPDILPLPPQDDDIDENERSGPHFRYRTFSPYLPIAARPYEEDVIGPENRPISFNVYLQNEDHDRANFAVRAHIRGDGPPPGSEVYQINQIAQARMRTEELYL